MFDADMSKKNYPDFNQPRNFIKKKLQHSNNAFL